MSVYNPVTGRRIMMGGGTYNDLVKRGFLGVQYGGMDLKKKSMVPKPFTMPLTKTQKQKLSSDQKARAERLKQQGEAMAQAFARHNQKIGVDSKGWIEWKGIDYGPNKYR